jgi:ACR3 family arsenite efflux pump ArsB
MKAEQPPGRIDLAAEHVKKYLLAYTILAVLVAVAVGYVTRAGTSAHASLFSNLIIALAILTIYPSMVQLKTESLARTFRSWKPIVISVGFVFVLSPLVAFLLAPSLGGAVGTGFFVSNVVPASSASLGYVLIAGGSLELATALAVVSFGLAIPLVPLYLDLYGSQTATAVPTGPILTSVVLILVIPFVVGQLTRYGLLRWKGKDLVQRGIRAPLSLATMVSMLALVFVMVDREAAVMVAKPFLVGTLLGYQTLIIVSTLLVALAVSWALRFSYEDHQAVAFISVSKNQSVAAGIATLALTPAATLAPATIPMVQPILAILYIGLEPRVRHFLRGKGSTLAPGGGAPAVRTPGPGSGG